MNAPAMGQIIVARRQLEIRGSIIQREEHLHASLAEGALADDGCAADLSFKRTGDDFAGAGRILVDEHDQRQSQSSASGLAMATGRLIAGVAIGLVLTITPSVEEFVRDIRCRQ